MTEMTVLDRAHAAMEAGQDDPQARLRFYETLAASELYVLLEEEVEADPQAGGQAGDESVAPRCFEVEGQSFVLVFDREDRLADFAGGPAPYAAMTGRAVAEALAEGGLGLGVNLEVAPSSILLPAEAVAWLAGILSERPEELEARATSFRPPAGLPDRLLTALDARLATAGGLADLAYLVAVEYDNGAAGHMLGIIDAVPGAQDALARAVSDGLSFSGLEAAALDVAFFRGTDPAAARLARVGLRFDLPKPERREALPGAAPGMDPDRPPRLK